MISSRSNKKRKFLLAVLLLVLTGVSYFFLKYTWTENIKDAANKGLDVATAMVVATCTVVALFLMLIALFIASDQNQIIRKSRALLVEAENSNLIIIENVADLITRQSLDGKFTFLSSASKRILGYDPPELIGMSLFDMIHPESMEMVRKSHFFLLSSTDVVAIAFRIRRKDGSHVRIESSFKVLRAPVSNEPQEIMCISSDVTKRIEEEDLFKQMVIFAEELLYTGSEQISYKKMLENVLYISKAKTAALTLLDDGTGKLESVAVAESNEFAGSMPGSVDKQLNMGEVTITKLIINHRHVGDLTLIMPVGRIFENNYLVKIYTRQIEMFITRTKAEQKLRESESSLAIEKRLLETTLISVGDGVISTAKSGHIVFLNRVAESLTGWKQSEAKGMQIEKVFQIVDAATGERIGNIAEKVIKGRKTIEMASQTNLISMDGVERPIEHTASPIMQEDGECTGVVLVFRDFTEKKLRQEEILYLSYHDQLTGLHNRRAFDHEVDRLGRKANAPLALVMLDVNGLKLTNDAFGHKAGDAFLARVGEILKRECRHDDIAARIGGDEFVLLLPEADVEKVELIIQRINKAIENEKIDNIIFSISIGYAVRLDVSDGIDDVFKRAEDNMYRHKLYESSSMRSKTIDIIIKTLYEKNNREMLHSKRVSELCEVIAAKLNFDKDAISQMRLAGLMHDIGKIGIDENILNKTIGLLGDEWNEMQRHSEVGYRILSSVNEFSEIANYVLEHHERWDGQGYPRGLKGDEISMQARIISVADAFDAITCVRTYKAAISEVDALVEIQRCSGSQFDPFVVKVFIEQVMGKSSVNEADTVKAVIRLA